MQIPTFTFYKEGKTAQRGKRTSSKLSSYSSLAVFSQTQSCNHKMHPSRFTIISDGTGPQNVKAKRTENTDEIQQGEKKTIMWKSTAKNTVLEWLRPSSQPRENIVSFSLYFLKKKKIPHSTLFKNNILKSLVTCYLEAKGTEPETPCDISTVSGFSDQKWWYSPKPNACDFRASCWNFSARNFKCCKGLLSLASWLPLKPVLVYIGGGTSKDG